MQAPGLEKWKPILNVLAPVLWTLRLSWQPSDSLQILTLQDLWHEWERTGLVQDLTNAKHDRVKLFCVTLNNDSILPVSARATKKDVVNIKASASPHQQYHRFYHDDAVYVHVEPSAWRQIDHTDELHSQRANSQLKSETPIDSNHYNHRC